MGGISWTHKEAFRLPTTLIRDLIGVGDYQLIIGECELASAAIAVLLWGLYDGVPRIIILCADNLNVFQWLEAA